MKTLSTLKMSEFIDISCGRLDAVLEEGEKVEKEEISKYVNRLLMDYKMIVNPVGIKAEIARQKQYVLRTGRIYVFKSCISLLSIGYSSQAREILSEIGLHYPEQTDAEIKKKIGMELKRLEFEAKRNESVDEEVDPPTEKYIRSMFDKEQAALMTYFKMHIDMNSISASVYANMLAQADREIKLRSKSLSKMK